MKCARCQAAATVFKPKVRFARDEGDELDDCHEEWQKQSGDTHRSKKTGGGNGGSTSKGVMDLLMQALEATQETTLQATFTKQITRLGEEASEASPLSPVEALRKANGNSRNIEHMHDQAEQSVPRLRSNLAAAAELKEPNLARLLVDADDARKAVTRALAIAEGDGGRTDEEDNNYERFKLKPDKSLHDQANWLSQVKFAAAQAAAEAKGTGNAHDESLGGSGCAGASRALSVVADCQSAKIHLASIAFFKCGPGPELRADPEAGRGAPPPRRFVRSRAIRASSLRAAAVRMLRSGRTGASQRAWGASESIAVERGALARPDARCGQSSDARGSLAAAPPCRQCDEVFGQVELEASGEADWPAGAAGEAEQRVPISEERASCAADAADCGWRSGAPGQCWRSWCGCRRA
ncbi:unnamed protein product [Prorocentrum cordatum]|uniref:Uncharacterized protein n=1 Tax=Prorocentrum cordatum TaxID=2364126 RepID=A0ABN9TK07_9DINO|nr:unnamed protein product [Polarella glacialis]